MEEGDCGTLLPLTDVEHVEETSEKGALEGSADGGAAAIGGGGGRADDGLLLSSMMTSCSGLATAELSKTLRASVSEIDPDSAAEGEEEDAAAALNELEESGEEGGVETRCFTANSRFIAEKVS